ncbi:secretory phospholipase A2 receptor-like, partial [Huso huso]
LSGFCVPAYNQIKEHVLVETVMSWSAAQSYCREKHTDLATVCSQEEAEQLLNITGASLIANAWIGLYRDDTQNWQWSNSDDVIYTNWKKYLFCASVNSVGLWEDNVCREESFHVLPSENEEIVKKAQGKTFWIGLFNEPWKWSHQGDNYTFHSWGSEDPNNWADTESCVIMTKSCYWYDISCNTLYPFFCCEGGSSGQCFYDATEKTWQDAQSYCRSQGRDQPSVQDQARANELIGLIPWYMKWNFWIGLYHDKENWQWSNGDDIIYFNWRVDLFCASVNSDGEWGDSVCSKQKAFMCYSGELRINSFVNETADWTGG